MQLEGLNDPVTIAVIVKMQWAVRKMLIRKGLRKDPKDKHAVHSKYFQDANYYETLQPKNSIDLSVLFQSEPKLERRVYAYKQTKSTYDGEWLGGFRHGRGTMIFSDGTTYEGQWQLGVAHGHGRLEVMNGTIYDGEWAFSRAYGKGKLIDSTDNTQYVGDFALDRKDGFGK